MLYDVTGNQKPENSTQNTGVRIGENRKLPRLAGREGALLGLLHRHCQGQAQAEAC